MMTEYEYGNIERALVQCFGITEDALKAFRARIRHFRNLGIPNIRKVGKGKRAPYSRDHISELWFALLLAQAGLSPTVIRDFVNSDRNSLRKWVNYCLEAPSTPYHLGISIRTFGPQPDGLMLRGEFFMEKDKAWEKCRSLIETGLPHILMIDFAGGVRRLSEELR